MDIKSLRITRGIVVEIETVSQVLKYSLSKEMWQRDLQMTAKSQGREWFNLVGLVSKRVGDFREEEEKINCLNMRMRNKAL